MSLVFENIDKFSKIKFNEKYFIKNEKIIKRWNPIITEQILSEEFFIKHNFIFLPIKYDEEYLLKELHNKNNCIYNIVSQYCVSEDFIIRIMNNYCIENIDKIRIFDFYRNISIRIFKKQLFSEKFIIFFLKFVFKNIYYYPFPIDNILFNVFIHQFLSEETLEWIIFSCINNPEIEMCFKTIFYIDFLLKLLLKHQRISSKFIENYKDDITIEHKKLLFHYQKEE